ncbi:alpha/beta hydrolase-fold protein [Serinibacter arcticus]|uniref:Putative esterase n=1 Tax=Serinibacter arcticus TaxID=1655435 RepID=A0A4Z1EB69_9MICO|nr:alpha/beta hydrolase-fold protein [Serinibacter arcticus]TGO06671.1 putative esterase [Serinibacter arcticus]
MFHHHPLARPLARSLALGAAALIAGTTLAVVPAGSSPAAAAPPAGTLTTTSAPSAAVGTIESTVYLPPGYDAAADPGDPATTRYPTLYLLHGRGDTMAAWTQVAPQLDALIDEGAIPPMIVVMPDAPWSERGSYYVDSLADGGAAVETAFTTDLVDHVDTTYATVDDRGARAVGGYSMGGAGALRYATAHQDLFSAGLVLSPAVYVPLPPADSSAREFGAYGVGQALFDDARYTELAYPSTFAALDPALPVRLFIAVGDDEWVNPLPEDALHDLDQEAATLYNAAKRVPGVSSELRVYDGGHDWGVWARGFEEGMRDLGPRLRTSTPPAFPGTQTGSDGEDFAGGVLAAADGGTITATNLAGSTAEHTGAGGLDAVVQRRGADGALAWTTAIAGPANDRAYGVVDDGDGGALVGGYSRAATDDMVLTRVSGAGERLWTTTAGDPAAADRAYAVAADGAGGALLAGYTSGSLPGSTTAGDKDAALVHVGAGGEVLWAAQLGGPGEDKAYAVTTATDGTVVVAGSTTGAMPGGTAAGGLDAWVAGYSPSGALLWLHQIGTGAADQLQALVTTPDGVVAAGYTGGVLPGAASSGGVDAMAIALGTDGTVRWQRQLGTAGDDRGAALVPGDDPASGGVTLVAHTDGAWGVPAGGVDVVVLPLDADGTPGEVRQLGSAQRDGADLYDEANLFAAAGTGPDGSAGVWVQGVTFGAVDGAANAGASDVFLTFVSLADGATQTPTTEPPATEPPTETGTGGALPPGAGGGAGGAGGGSGAGGAGAGSALGATGSDAARLLAAAAALTLAGGGLVLRRRRTRGLRLTAG